MRAHDDVKVCISSEGSGECLRAPWRKSIVRHQGSKTACTVLAPQSNSSLASLLPASENAAGMIAWNPVLTWNHLLYVTCTRQL